MAYDPQLFDRLISCMENIPNVETKFMFGGVCFMVNDKMCIGIIQDNLMCRIGPENFEMAIDIPGCRPMDFSKRPMIGYVYVEKDFIQKNDELQFWIALCLKFNPFAKKSIKKSSNKR